MWQLNHYWTPISCTPGNDGPYPTAWIYYVISMLWDTGTLSVSSFYLVRYNSINGRSVLFTHLYQTYAQWPSVLIADCLGWSERKGSWPTLHAAQINVPNRMIYDGLGYFLVLTGRISPCCLSCAEHPGGVNVFNLILYRASDKAVQVRVSLFPLKLHLKLYGDPRVSVCRVSPI